MDHFINRAKKNLAALMALCLVMGSVLPAYAEAETMPEAGRVTDAAVEGVCAEAAAALEATEDSGDVTGETAAGTTAEEGAEAYLLGELPSVTYLDYNESTKEFETKTVPDGYEQIVSSSAITSLEAGKWYVVEGQVSLSCRLVNEGTTSSPTRLVLANGCEFSVYGGIENGEACELIIYAQTENTDLAGSLLAGNTVKPDDWNPIDYCAGIGGTSNKDGAVKDNGRVTINGGNITAIGGTCAAGIGGGFKGAGVTITINGGFVTAYCGRNGNRGPGIGGGLSAPAGNITINGGVVTADGTASGTYYGGAGIGLSGSQEGTSPSGTITINGGTVTATGGRESAGIGGSIKSKGVTITINGGTVTAAGGEDGAGIGGSFQGDCGTVTITGGNVTATGGEYAAGIGGGNDGKCGTVAISGGFVRATAGTGGAGIGGGQNGNGGDVTITGGATTAIGNGGVGIGAGSGGSAHGGFSLDDKEESLEILAGGDAASAVLMSGLLYAAYRKTYADVHEKPCYTVKHLKQKADGSGYEEAEADRQVYSAHTGDITTAGIKGYEGFTARPFEQQQVKTDGSTVIEISYDRNSYKIFFDMNGHGVAPDPVVARYGAEVSAPEEPEAAGFVFGGWFTTRACITAFPFDTMPLGGAVAYAKWTPAGKPSYTILWNDSDGTELAATSVEEGGLPVYPGGKPEKAGFAFIGWEPTVTVATKDTAYVAQYIRTVEGYHVVSFESNGGTPVAAAQVKDGETAARPADPTRDGFTFDGWHEDPVGTGEAYAFTAPVTKDLMLYAKWTPAEKKTFTIVWKDYDGKELAKAAVEEGGLPVYFGNKPSRNGYVFTGWDKDITLAFADATYTATYAQQIIISGGGGGGTAVTKKATVTFSSNWFSDAFGVWRIRDKAGNVVTNAWLCDDAVTANGQNVWYLLTADGAMIAAGLVQDNTGNFYSLETEHNGYFGMLRYTDGYYNCNGQQVYLKFNREHNGSFGAVANADGLEKLKAIYGVTKFGIGNESAVCTSSFQ